MNATDKLVDPITGTSSLVRPRYSPGLLLEDADLTQAVDYTRDLSRLLFRSLFGCGVICGLTVSVDPVKCNKLRVSIAPGVALDSAGDPVQLTSAQTFTIDLSCLREIPRSICVVLRHWDRSCLPRSAACTDDDDANTVATRIHEGFELRLIGGPCPKGACGCLPRVVEVPEPVPAEAPAAPAPLVVEAPAAAEVAASDRANARLAMAWTSRGCCCASPDDDCYKAHYAAECTCCGDSGGWVVLGRVLHLTGTVNGVATDTWVPDHGVRRLIRPVLICDRLADSEAVARIPKK